MGDNASGEMDVARFDTAMSTFAIAQDKWIAKDSDGNYETNSSGDLLTFTAEADVVSTGYTAVKAYSFTSTEDGEAVVDIVAEIEGIEFSDGFARFDVEAVAEDYDFDGVADFAVIGGGLSNDILGVATIDTLASYESWADAYEVCSQLITTLMVVMGLTQLVLGLVMIQLILEMVQEMRVQPIQISSTVELVMIQ